VQSPTAADAALHVVEMWLSIIATSTSTSFLCLITPLCSYLYGGLYGGLYERAHIIRIGPVRVRGGRTAST
jgi:hypothetical protein